MSYKHSLPFYAAFFGMISVQTGAAFAKTLFPIVGSEGVAALRIGLSALVLFVLMRPWRLWRSNVNWPALALYGLILALMNLLIYRAFMYIPVSIAIAIEVMGPLGVALLKSKQKSDLVWVCLSTAGMLFLSVGDDKGEIDYRGVLYSIAAAFFWGMYVIYGSKVASGGGMTVATGMLIAACITVPLGLSQAGSVLLSPHILGVGLLVAILSSMLPFLFDIYAMGRLPPRIFGILLSGSPVVSAIAGWMILRETLTLMQCSGIACVMAACAGCALFSSRSSLPSVSTQE